MTRTANRLRELTLILVVVGCPSVLHAANPSAEAIIEQTKVRRGLVIILGNTDGALEADLAADGHMLVQTLTTDAAACTKA